MENKTKIRINLNLREFEIEGSEAFINSHSAKIVSFLEILKTVPPINIEPTTHHEEKNVVKNKTAKTTSSPKEKNVLKNKTAKTTSAQKEKNVVKNKTTKSTSAPKGKSVAKNKTAKSTSAPKGNSDGNPESFGEYYRNMPKKSKEADKILLAGNFIQSKSDDNSFSTREASAALLEQGIKLSNSAVFIGQNEKAKHVIKISKGKFRVSKTGLEHIEQLLTGQIEK